MSGSKKKDWILFSILTLLVCIASFFVIQNTRRLQSEVEQRTQIYVSDVSGQMAKTIDNRLARNITDLEATRDSLFRIDTMTATEFHDFLVQKAHKYYFSSMIVIKADGTLYQSGGMLEDVMSLSGIQESFEGKNSVTFLDEFNILYSVPIYLDGKIVGVLGGVCDQENMLSQIKEDSFTGKGTACVIDTNADIVVTATDPEPFLMLDDIFQEKEDNAFIKNVHFMLEEIKQKKSGVFRFHAADGSDMILTYNPLESYSWVLLTLVPSDVFSATIDNYMHESQVIVGGIILLMILILFLLFRNWKTHYEQLEQAVFVDRITGGMTDIAFQLQCRTLFHNAPPNTYSVVLFNIKNFKLINDHLGTQCGNEVLSCVMHILQKYAGEGGLAARTGSDTFYLCLKEGNREKIAKISDNIVAEVEKQAGELIRTRGALYCVSLQPGVYIVDDPKLEITIMQDRANVASRTRAEWEESVCKFYDSSIMTKLKKEQEYNSLFQSSLENRDFLVYFQPKVSVENGLICGAEALVRWNHPQKGLLSPADFIPLFEVNGNIRALDLYIFEEVCKNIKRWLEEGRKPLPISVNLSRRHFQRGDCMTPFFEIAQRYQVPKGLIELELTESIFFDDKSIDDMKKQIREIHAMDFHCALDDFGFGYSSLCLLMEFDIDIIKMDRRFFFDVSNAKTRDVIASIIELAHKIGASTVAEGIESAEQIAFLREVHCDMIQGYAYAKPLPVEEFEAWWEENLHHVEIEA